MMKSDYGRLYYSVSKDGLHWKLLKKGKRVCKDYRGHPDICRGHDGRFYMTGGSDRITIWVSDDLVSWSKLLELKPDVYKTPDFKPQERIYGAPKIYYDKDTGQYLITWHTSQNNKLREKPEYYWAGQRTLYITSKDLNTFTAPRRLFRYDMATIDVIVRKIDGRYYAIMKDELYPSFDCPQARQFESLHLRISPAPGLNPHLKSPPISARPPR
jgi:hypothetical protein